MLWNLQQQYLLNMQKKKNKSRTTQHNEVFGCVQLVAKITHEGKVNLYLCSWALLPFLDFPSDQPLDLRINTTALDGQERKRRTAARRNFEKAPAEDGGDG